MHSSRLVAYFTARLQTNTGKDVPGAAPNSVRQVVLGYSMAS